MTAIDERAAGSGFRHEALLYSTDDEFVARTAAFVRAGLANDDAVLVVVEAGKIARLRDELGSAAARVEFADMASIGRNPALIIQAWRDFVSSRRVRGRALRGVGEPVSPARDAAALAECHIHEALLNIAFETECDFWLLCPYDMGRLSESVVESARRNHPFVCDHDGSSRAEARPVPVEERMRPLPDPPGPTAEIEFGAETLQPLRRFVTMRSAEAGLEADRVADLVVAVSEIATNTVVHGLGRGIARMWVEGPVVVFEIQGPGHISDPLAGRLRPLPGQTHGYGIWLANQFCDLVQIRSTALGTTAVPGTTVRLCVRRD